MKNKPVPGFLISVRVVAKHLTLELESGVPFSIPHFNLNPSSIYFRSIYVSLVHPFLFIFPGPSAQLAPKLC